MIDCSKTANYLSEKLRMTKKTKNGLCKIKCGDCPLCCKNNGTSEGLSCVCFEMYYPEKAISIIQKWSDAHQQKTYLSELLTHFPKVKLDDTGTPKGVCLYALGLINKDDCDNNCVKCWTQAIPIEDGEE